MVQYKMEALMDLTKSSDHITITLKDKTSQIKIVGTYEDPYFCGRDVCDVLEYSNTKKALLEHVRSKHKKMLSEMKGKVDIEHGQKHLEKLIYPYCKAIYISNIIVAFMHHKVVTQYIVDDYRIDLYFPDRKIAVECDEYGHRDRDPEAEKIRQNCSLTPSL